MAGDTNESGSPQPGNGTPVKDDLDDILGSVEPLSHTKEATPVASADSGITASTKTASNSLENKANTANNGSTNVVHGANTINLGMNIPNPIPEMPPMPDFLRISLAEGARNGELGDIGELNSAVNVEFPVLDNLGDIDPSNLPDPGSLLGFNGMTTDQQSSEEIERDRMKLLISHFDEQQMARYLAFRRANIRRAAVRRYASHLLNQPISNNVAMVLAGMSKVLIGDIIELAREIQDAKEGRTEHIVGVEPDPLLPSSIREAWRIYKSESNSVPGSKVRSGSGNRLF